jgi:hypothetical protein
MQMLFMELDSEVGNRILGQNRIQDKHISVQDTTRFGWRCPRCKNRHCFSARDWSGIIGSSHSYLTMNISNDRRAHEDITILSPKSGRLKVGVPRAGQGMDSSYSGKAGLAAQAHGDPGELIYSQYHCL